MSRLIDTQLDGNGDIILSRNDVEIARVDGAGNLSTKGAVNGGSISVVPEKYGAAANGVTDDTAALLLWAASGLPLALTAGKTYLHRQTIPLATSGQVLDGKGATLKRAAQVITTTTTSISAAIATITVADASGLRVGDQIVVEQGGTYDAAERTISSIVGNVVTCNHNFGVTLSGTTNVRTGWKQVFIQAPDVRVINLQIDGNSANWSWARWQHSCAIFADKVTLAPDRGVIQNCRVFNFYGDAYSPGNFNTFWVIGCTAEAIQGRGISWAGGTTPGSFGGRCLYNRLFDCDKDTAVAASDGLGNIQVSSNSQDFLIHGNHCETGQVGIGSLNSANNSDFTITDNEIRGMATFAIDSNSPSGDSANNVIIANNRIYNSIAVRISQQSSGSANFPSRFIVEGNLFVNTKLQGNFANYLMIEGNNFSGGGTTMMYIDVDAVKRLAISNNMFQDGSYAMNLGDVFDALLISGNVMYGLNDRGINFFGASATFSTVQGNIIELLSGAAASCYGIVVNSSQVKMSLKNNEISLQRGNYGIFIAGNNNIIQGNTVRHGGTAIGTIQINAGATTNYVLYNTVDLATVDGGTTTVKTGEQVVV